MSARRVLLATVLPAALLAGPVAGSASADTTTPDVISGGPGSVTFAAAAGQAPIKQIEVDLPTGTPLRDVTVPATPGWTSATTTAALPSCGDEAVSSVTWTATGDGTASPSPGSFAIQVGSFPKADRMEFTGVITYADGMVVKWSQADGLGSDLVARPPLGAASAVTVRAESSAPQPAALQPGALQPAAPAPQANPTSSWVTTFFRMVMSAW